MKRKIAIFLLGLFLLNVDIGLAYEFPEPDWGAVYNERKAMIDEVDFDIYAESSQGTAPYFGMRNEPLYGAYLGMTTDTTPDFAPLGSYLSYIDTVGQTDFYFPSWKMIREDNVITTVGWNFTSLDDIDYNNIRETLNTLEKYNKPMCIRFAAEMNCSPLGDDPEKYVSVFRNVANMIHEYPNFAVVWSPNDFGGLDRPFEYYYPGDEYVDWVGVSCYTRMHFMNDTNPQERDKIFFMLGDNAWATNRVKPVIDFMKKFNINKPVMLSEGGIATSNRLEQDYTDWSPQRLRNMLYYLVMKFPQIKLINYFNVFGIAGISAHTGELEKFDITDKPYAVDIFREAAANGPYIRELGDLPRFTYVPADAKEIHYADGNGIVNLYTLAHLPKTPKLTINYSIDGTWYSLSQQIPYKCALDLNTLSDGKHTIKIATEGKEKSYTFMKSGNSIRFGTEQYVNNEQQGGSEQPIEPIQPVQVTDEIKVNLYDEYLKFSQPPVIIDGSTLVPMRAIFEALGSSVEWFGETRSIVAEKDGTILFLQIGSKTMYKNETEITLNVEAQLINGNTMVPIRAVSESFGCDVEWNGGERTVYIY